MRLADKVESKGLIVSPEASSYFMIPLLVKLANRNLKVSALLEFGASTCFINKKFAECHKLSLIIKKYFIFVKVIDGRPLESGDVTEETIPLNIFIGWHQSIVIFNVIYSPSNPMILGFSWLDIYNPIIDWTQRN